ncbi:mannosyltransferase family protein [Actinopolymorpha sp. NPDC004070]|uniref:mannosyltransferase family protein n=1 Tax=Actinopolymorpha sp. NPDC004070 TaxID=3154548 RepID=UPI0033A1E838
MTDTGWYGASDVEASAPPWDTRDWNSPQWTMPERGTPERSLDTTTPAYRAAGEGGRYEGPDDGVNDGPKDGVDEDERRRADRPRPWWSDELDASGGDADDDVSEPLTPMGGTPAPAQDPDERETDRPARQREPGQPGRPQPPAEPVAEPAGARSTPPGPAPTTPSGSSTSTASDARGPQGSSRLRWLPERLRPTPGDVQVLAWWAVTRLGILLVAVTGPWLFHGTGKIPSFWDSWKQWDFWHFDRIATFGYFAPGWSTPIEAFFPGFPMVLRLGVLVGIPTVVGGLLVSFVAGGVAAVALARLADREWGPGAGRYAAAMWMLAPPAIFLAAPYTEALFLALAIPAWLSARRGNWWLAAVLAAGACTVRVSGIFLVVALAVEFLTSGRRKGWLEGLWLALPMAPVLGYMAYLKVNTGDWLRWYHAQSDEWYRGFTLPWTAFFNTWNAATGHTAFGDVSDALRANFEWMFRAELVAMLVGLVVTVVLLTLRRWGEATWVGVQVAAFATSYWFFSVPRATLLWFPLWIGLGALAVRRPWVWRAYVILAVPLFGIWAAAYLTGRWSG